MAAVTPAHIETGVADGDRFIRGQFTGVTVANGDTWDTGLKGVSEVAWKADTAADVVVVTESAGVVTFVVVGTTNGEVWATSADY